MKAGDQVALAIGGVVAVGVVAFVAFTNVSDTHLAESKSKIRKSERVAFYENPGASDAPAATGKHDAAPAQSKPETARPRGSARESMAAYAELFKKLSAWLRASGSVHYDRMRQSGAVPASGRQELIDLICETAQLGGPVCPLDFVNLESNLRHLTDTVDCALLACDYAKEKLANGDLPEALRGFVAVMNLADAIADEPLAESQYTKQQIYASLIKSLDYKALPPDLAKAIIERLSRAGNRSAFRESLYGELLVANRAFENWRNASYSEMIDRDGFYWGTRSWLWVRPVCRPWFDKDQQVAIDMIMRMIEVPDLPYYQVEPTLNQILSDVNNLPISNNVGKWNAQGHLRGFFLQARFESLLNAAQLRIAVEQYRKKNGEYPKTLDAVMDWFGGTRPVDPFTGHPYPYKIEGDSYVLDDTFRHGPGLG